ncbi:MAG: radical SAM protein [Desulfomonilia bacterium]
MEQLKDREHDFSAKLRQASVMGSLKEYISWQRKVRSSSGKPKFPRRGPISVNLDLTTACNFSCPHCVDSRMLNTGDYLDLDSIKRSIETLQDNGLLSVILIGGGEPTLHKNFEEIVRFISQLGLQIGIATNGSRLEKVASVADVLREGDWLRLSLDAASESTFFKSHRPRGRVTLEKILNDAMEIKKANSALSLGYSFVIVWKGIFVNGYELNENVQEMHEAVRLARDHLFDYISYKPCLLRLEGSQKESLFTRPDEEREAMIIEEIVQNLEKAKNEASDGVKILESVNLAAMIDRTVHELKVQPQVCHSQFFRTVLAPSGIFHCPALRGVKQGMIGTAEGYTSDENFEKTQANLERSILKFDAAKECAQVVCFYHHVNWWIENFIASGKSLRTLTTVEDNNFFL